jgi:mercuric ion transport protein
MTASPETRGRWAILSAILSAVGASACCWLPLGLGLVGLTGSVATSTLGALRPVLLPLALVLLGIAWWQELRRCAVADCCSRGNLPWHPRRDRLWLLLGVTALVAGSWLYPLVVEASTELFPLPVISAADDSLRSSPVVGPGDSLACYRLRIGGMSCAVCAVHLKRALLQAGAQEARLEYPTGAASVCIPRSVSLTKLTHAVSRAGYRVISVREQSSRDTSHPVPQPRCCQ